jgi:uncharacterized protein Yka (UPF0111/DUF47 family)
MNDDCPVGITNKKEIEKMKDVFGIMIENLNLTISNLGTTMEKKFDELNNKIDKVDSKIDAINNQLPDQINSIVDNKMKVGVFSVVKWLSISICGVVIATVVGKTITNLM